jgi:hypothetical protein
MLAGRRCPLVALAAAAVGLLVMSAAMEGESFRTFSSFRHFFRRRRLKER